MKYLVMTLRTPQFDPACVAPHYAFLDALRAAGTLDCAGPFTDKSGGAYLLKVGSLAEAQAIADRDPVHTTGSSIVSVHEWNAQ